jgi:uncharacterized protein YkwD
MTNDKQTQFALERVKLAISEVLKLNEELSTIAEVKSLRMDVNGAVFEVDFT